MPEDPAARRVVARRYELIAPHRPGSRTVWHARDRVLRRDVVVQLLRLPPAERPAVLRQVRAAARSPRLGAVVILAAVLDGDDIAVVTELPIARTPAEIVAELTGPGPKPATGEPARFTPSSTWRNEPLPSSKVAGPPPVARKRWRLGPWPVSPGAVRTREQLVRAFEYLSLLLLGPAARTRHHHDLARQIGDQPDMDPDRRKEAAQALAGLYEQARYAPPQDDLSEEQLDRARRELRRLAGGAA